jgi:phosphoribosylamine--glycine ligase
MTHEGMVHALTEIHRVLTPQGWLADLRPDRRTAMGKRWRGLPRVYCLSTPGGGTLAGFLQKENLADHRAVWRPGAAVSVVLASGGYPGEHQTGKEISGLGAASSLEGVQLFHAATARRGGSVLTAGGRVLAVSATGRDLAEARGRAYDAAERIEFEGKHYRRDIARKAAER